MIPVITPVVISVIESLISVVVTTSSTVVSEMIFFDKKAEMDFFIISEILFRSKFCCPCFVQGYRVILN